ncbi:transposase IS116/IS110/IS902 family protein [Thermoanaerobacter italicus Ab9]|uniref:Transposase IS116/IS110/IS902 family protein n=1 Tax=Thermoanaerobacter italicus (strain DSM 9252 / Ab9) TaxID=580331 RepID=D3T4H6_THEIA|nr:IS110 family transposase [Thermoanaerobacter italicus]ADD03128.1 transposase IS116/IS110/IS902 family protein [Thermoanaerobacter italicus Ab9]
MKYTQNEKILQVTEKTLIVGVDIAKEKHHARAFDYRGVVYGKRLEFGNNREGMENFLAWAMDLMRENGKDHLMVGMEPTGHYWLCFALYLKDNNVKVVLVNPFHVKRSKELDDNSPTKSDHKDPKTIAMLVKDGRYVEPNIPEGIYAELRVAMDVRERLNKQLGMIKNQVVRWLDIYFPEFNTVFADWEGKAALVTLKEFPTPEKIAKKSMEEILSCWEKEVQRAIGQKRAIKLLDAAKKSIGKNQGIKMAEYELKSILEQYELFTKQLEEVGKEIEELVMQVPGVSEMLKIKGIGINTVAGFISEVGDIERYEHPKQIQKLAGLNLVENSSGKHKGETVISKRGRRRLRSILFKAIMPIVAKNKEFQELHKYYTTRAQNPLKKKQSLIALCCKIIRIFYVILRKGVKYDPVKMLKDIKRPTLQGVA